MKITVFKEVDMTEEQQEIYNKGFDDGVKSVHRREIELKEDRQQTLAYIYCAGFVILIQVLVYFLFKYFQ